MSQDIRIGKTIDASIKFTMGNAWSLIRVGWLPFALTIGITSFLAWHFWQPLILAYMEFLSAYADVATDQAALERLMESFTRDVENAIEGIGFANFLLGYAGILIIGTAGAAIVMTAYIRMMALGETPGGIAYFRFGAREINVAATYLLVVILAAITVIAVSFVTTLVLVVPFAGSEGAGTAIAVLGVLASMIISLVLFFWVFARLLIAVPASAIHGGVPIMQSWRATKGLGGRITGIILLGYLILFAISMIVMMILGMATQLIDSALVSMGSQLAPYFSGTLWGVGYIAVACLTNAFFVGLFTSVFMGLDQGEGTASS